MQIAQQNYDGGQCLLRFHASDRNESSGNDLMSGISLVSNSRGRSGLFRTSSFNNGRDYRITDHTSEIKSLLRRCAAANEQAIISSQERNNTDVPSINKGIAFDGVSSVNRGVTFDSNSLAVDSRSLSSDGRNSFDYLSTFHINPVSKGTSTDGTNDRRAHSVRVDEYRNNGVNSYGSGSVVRDINEVDRSPSASILNENVCKCFDNKIGTAGVRLNALNEAYNTLSTFCSSSNRIDVNASNMLLDTIAHNNRILQSCYVLMSNIYAMCYEHYGVLSNSDINTALSLLDWLTSSIESDITMVNVLCNRMSEGADSTYQQRSLMNHYNARSNQVNVLRDLVGNISL